MFVLVSTNGYSIDHAFYLTEKEAKDAMRNQFSWKVPDEWDEEWEAMSYLAEKNAILYTGDDVFVWKIIDLCEE